MLLVACEQGGHLGQANQAAPKMQLTSPAFAADQSIPIAFTCDGADQSPALSWDNPPAETQSFALIVTRLDASPPLTHWILYDLPPDARSLPAALPTQPFLTAGMQGKNDFGQYGYRGPCSPESEQCYSFKLYAVDTVLDLPPGATYSDIMAALAGRVLAEAELTGRYGSQ
jgi:Raf kinase inhibitor-like YbhB/YbcL family protein